MRPALFASSVLYLNLIFDELLRAVWRLEFNYGLLNAAFPGLAVALVLGPLLVAGLSTLVLTVLDGAPSRRKFGRMFRALGYATAIGLVLWIPYAPFIALPYGLYVATVAVKEALSISWRRAAVAALAPLAPCCSSTPPGRPDRTYGCSSTPGEEAFARPRGTKSGKVIRWAGTKDRLRLSRVTGIAYRRS